MSAKYTIRLWFTIMFIIFSCVDMVTIDDAAVTPTILTLGPGQDDYTEVPTGSSTDVEDEQSKSERKEQDRQENIRQLEEMLKMSESFQEQIGQIEQDQILNSTISTLHPGENDYATRNADSETEGISNESPTGVEDKQSKSDRKEKERQENIRQLEEMLKMSVSFQEKIGQIGEHQIVNSIKSIPDLGKKVNEKDNLLPIETRMEERTTTQAILEVSNTKAIERTTIARKKEANKKQKNQEKKAKLEDILRMSKPSIPKLDKLTNQVERNSKGILGLDILDSLLPIETRMEERTTTQAILEAADSEPIESVARKAKANKNKRRNKMSKMKTKKEISEMFSLFDF